MEAPQGIQVAAMETPWGLRRGSGGLRRGSAHKNMGFRGDSVGIRGTPWGLRRDSAMRVEKAVLFSLYVFTAFHAGGRGLRLPKVDICGVPFLAEQPPFKIKKGERRARFGWGRRVERCCRLLEFYWT